MPGSLRAAASSAVVLLALGLGACAGAMTRTPLTAAAYADLQRQVAASSEARGVLNKACEERLRTKPPRTLASFAAVLDVDVADVVQIYCERMTAAIGRNDITYDDYVAMEAREPDPALMRKMLRVLRRDAGELRV